MKVKCRFIKEPICYGDLGINLLNEIVEGEFNVHGAFGVAHDTLIMLGCNPDIFIGETVFFSSKHVVELPSVAALEAALTNANGQSAKYYKWYLASCAEVEKLKGELAHEKGKSSSSDTS